jgi:hypothetical protein
MDMRHVFQEKRNRFKELFRGVENVHKELEKFDRGHQGHGFFDHDLMVAQYAIMIAPNERVAEMAWVAALLHSLDRMFGGDAALRRNELVALLPYNNFNHTEMVEIIDAVEHHDSLNMKDDSLTKITLQDADRLANSDAIVIARSGQFHPKIPCVIPNHIATMTPGSKYNNPSSVIDDLRGCLEWEHLDKVKLRLPKAIELGKEKFQYLRDYIARIQRDFANLGLDPFSTDS